MKRFKSLLAGLCTLALVVAFAVGSFGYVPTAYAADGSVRIQSSSIAFDNDVKAPAKTVKYGDTFIVPTATDNNITVTVTDPAGKPYNGEANGEYRAKMLGNYIIEYKYKRTPESDGITYTYKMLSTLDDELELRIAEADIPSVVKKGKSVVLPEAKVGFYNEDGKWVSYDGAAVKITATAGTETVGVTKNSDGNYSYEFKANGTTFIKYVATLNNGKKHLEKTYEVKVQNEFSDTSAPTLSVSGVPSSASVNTAVTLPVATATHGTDERVKVTVTVKDPNGNPVKDVNVNDDGFATSYENAPAVEFDNDKTMKFYPTEKGTYEVTYLAEADNEKQSYPRTYRITVSDKKAPVVEIDDTKIPAKWGYSKVTNKTTFDGHNKPIEIEKETTVTFPFPSKLVDNVTEKGKLTVRFEITDPEKKQAVVVANANSTESGSNKNTIASYEGATDVEFTADNGFTFDFGKYADSKSNDKSYQVAGEYTVKYVVRDEAGVSTTKTYTIELVDEFVDEAAVTVSFDDVPSQTVYASATEAVKYTVPAATVSCENDSRLSVTYKIGTTEVKAGDEYEITEKNNKYYLTIDGTEIEVTSAGFKVEATAVSDTGTSKTASIDVKVFIPSGTKAFEFTSSIADPTVGNTNLTFGGYYKVAALSGQSADDLGIELGFKNSDGANLKFEAEFYVANNALYVRNISVDNLGKNGLYYLEVKAFDRNGFEEVMVYEYDVKFATSGGGGYPANSASAIKASSSEISSSVKLDKTSIDSGDINNSTYFEDDETNANYETQDKYIVKLAYEVKGGKFSVIGDDFTALNTGDYSITKKIVLLNATSADKQYESTNATKATALADYLEDKETTDKLSVSDTSTVKFELAEELVPYVEKDSTVTIPAGIAYTEFANATVTAKVTDPNGSDVKVTNDTFKAIKNGTYTVTYTAKIDGKEDKTFSYTFKAGNVTAPEFTVEGGKDYTAKIGSTFKFAKINKVEGDTDGKAYTYTKTLTLNGTTIASGTGWDYETSSDAITLSESGKYTVTYTVTDEAGNKSSVVYSVTVTSESNSGGISLAALSAILIVVGVLLIAGVIVYLFRFRTVKKG